VSELKSDSVPNLEDDTNQESPIHNQRTSLLERQAEEDASRILKLHEAAELQRKLDLEVQKEEEEANRRLRLEEKARAASSDQHFDQDMKRSEEYAQGLQREHVDWRTLCDDDLAKLLVTHVSLERVGKGPSRSGRKINKLSSDTEVRLIVQVFDAVKGGVLGQGGRITTAMKRATKTNIRVDPTRKRAPYGWVTITGKKAACEAARAMVTDRIVALVRLRTEKKLSKAQQKEIDALLTEAANVEKEMEKPKSMNKASPPLKAAWGSGAKSSLAVVLGKS
jgi:hypothetical protein